MADASTDIVFIEGLAVETVIGVYDWERDKDDDSIYGERTSPYAIDGEVDDVLSEFGYRQALEDTIIRSSK